MYGGRCGDGGGGIKPRGSGQFGGNSSAAIGAAAAAAKMLFAAGVPLAVAAALAPAGTTLELACWLCWLAELRPLAIFRLCLAPPALPPVRRPPRAVSMRHVVSGFAGAPALHWHRSAAAFAWPTARAPAPFRLPSLSDGGMYSSSVRAPRQAVTRRHRMEARIGRVPLDLQSTARRIVRRKIGHRADHDGIDPNQLGKLSRLIGSI